MRANLDAFLSLSRELRAKRDRVGRTQLLVTQSGDVPLAYAQSEYDRLGRLANFEDRDAATLLGPAVKLKYLVFSYETGTDNLATIQRRGNHNGTAWQNTLTSTLAYDKASRLTSITHDLGPSGASASDIVHSYGYDNASRVTSFNTTGTGAATRAYQYDDAGQLTNYNNQAGGGFDFASYEYDDNGNRTEVNGAPYYDIGLSNRVLIDDTYEYEYDNEGNVIRREPIGARTYTEYKWDHRNRLVQVIEGDEFAIRSTISYTYDAQGRRVKRVLDPDGATGKEPVQTDSFVYDGDELSMTFTGTGAAAPVLEHRYLHGPADQVLVDEVFNASGQLTDSLWPLADHQGTPRDVVDVNGVVRKHTTFDSFGRITGEQFYARNGSLISSTHAEAVDQEIAYTGQFRDRDTGLQLHGRRWYDPGTGRWLSEDPTGFAGGDANLYRYVGNSPLNHTDPSGTTQAGGRIKPRSK